MSVIALDAMGGDHGVGTCVTAAAQASLKRQATIMLVGDRDAIKPVLHRTAHDAEFIEIIHASQNIEMGDDPRSSIAEKPDASILVAAKLVADGHADALVSAGNTGAGILACAEHFQTLPGVSRAALAAVFPTERRRGRNADPFSLILDVGATLNADARALVAFAHMGSAYAACISSNPNPTVALLSNGSESYKGPAEVVEANRVLSEDPHINFIGNIEGTDLPRGAADVVVTAGFTGNVVLKMLEGIGETVGDLARYAYRSKLTWRIGLMMLKGGFVQLKQVSDWEQYGGAPILGFDHLFIKAHGRSSSRAINNAIKVAHRAVQADLCNAISQRLPQP